MKTKRLDKEDLINQIFAIDLSEFIKTKQQNLIRVANSGLVILFWHIGKEINKFLNNSKSTHNPSNIISFISTQLIPKYGPFFSETNLRAMVQFADLFPRVTTLQKFSHVISWAHILLLLRCENRDELQFYLNLKIKSDLSVKELQAAMSSRLHEQNWSKYDRKEMGLYKDGEITKNPVNHLSFRQHNLWLKVLNDRVTENVFKDPLFLSFFQLARISKEKQDQSVLKSTSQASLQKKLLTTITWQVGKYKSEQNQWLNIYFNLYLWEIGNRISEELRKKKANISSHIFFQNLSKILKKKFGKTFTVKQLRAITEFADQIDDLEKASFLANFISWEQILELLKLPQLEVKFYYAKESAMRGMTLAALRNEIANKTIDKYPDAKKIGKSLIINLKAKRTTTIQNKNSTITIKRINYESTLKNIITPDIFQNSFLIDFLQHYHINATRKFIPFGESKKN